jgi:hypothetical protein
MSRYPSSGVERFDQQFAETDSERNERLRRKRLKTSAETSDVDRLLLKENEIARLMTENIRLRGVLDQISREGECSYARRLALKALGGGNARPDEYDHYANEDHMGQGG